MTDTSWFNQLAVTNVNHDAQSWTVGASKVRLTHRRLMVAKDKETALMRVLGFHKRHSQPQRATNPAHAVYTNHSDLARQPRALSAAWQKRYRDDVGVWAGEVRMYGGASGRGNEQRGRESPR